jgi:transposase
MLTPQEAAEAKAMQERGWTISVIARHLYRDRKTIRRYLTGERVPGPRRSGPNPLAHFTDYCRRRFTDAPHLPASTLFEELVELGYQGAYSTFTRALRHHDLRPHCDTCHSTQHPPEPINSE